MPLAHGRYPAPAYRRGSGATLLSRPQRCISTGQVRVRHHLFVLQRYQYHYLLSDVAGSQRFSATLRARYDESQRLAGLVHGLRQRDDIAIHPAFTLLAGEITQVLRRAPKPPGTMSASVPLAEHLGQDRISPCPPRNTRRLNQDVTRFRRIASPVR